MHACKRKRKKKLAITWIVSVCCWPIYFEDELDFLSKQLMSSLHFNELGQQLWQLTASYKFDEMRFSLWNLTLHDGTIFENHLKKTVWRKSLWEHPEQLLLYWLRFSFNCIKWLFHKRQMIRLSLSKKSFLILNFITVGATL